MLWGAGNNLETKFFLSLNEHLENMFGGIQMKISGISFFPHHTVTEIECHIDLWYETQKNLFSSTVYDWFRKTSWSHSPYSKG